MDVIPGYTMSDKLESIPALDGLAYHLLSAHSTDDANPDAYVVGIDAQDNMHALAYIDGANCFTYACKQLPDSEHPNPKQAGEEPLIKLVGELSDKTGQIVIKQPEGHWRRYSRWDKLDKAPATQPHAVVRTLPQCGCGGYLGAPMMFDSFNEMVAYFFVVFSDAQAVNAKHAAILTGDSCSIDLCSI